MLKAFLYEGGGKDREIELGDSLPALSEDSLLWVDVTGNDDTDRERLRDVFKLPAALCADMARKSRPPGLNNYVELIHLTVTGVLPPSDPRAVLSPPEVVKLDIVVGQLWLITLHPEDLPFLVEFRAQDRGETLIGKLSSASLASSLLDWHLGPFLAATEKLEAFCDETDMKMLKSNRPSNKLLPQLTAARRYVARLISILAPQREVFYGLSRADIKLVIDAEAREDFTRLEHHFERVLDVVENGRALIKDSLDLHAARVAENTNVLLRRLTVLSVMLGVIGAVAGLFGMNFDTAISHTGDTGFWVTIAILSVLVASAIAISRWRRLI